jgi:IclR family transcriptional regulator, pca regulon regulatory protein
VARRDTSRFFENVRTGRLRPDDGAGADARDQGGDYIQSLERGLAAIRAFTEDRSALSVTEVAERANVSRAAARRILFTLKSLGYVGTTENGLYRLEPAVLSLGYAYISSLDLPEVAKPYMERLANELGVSSSLGLLKGTDVTFIARIRSPGYLNTTFAVGSSLPAHLTAMGRVLLADLPDEELEEYLAQVHPEPLTELTLTSRDALRDAVGEARRTGFSLVDQELTPGVRALAVPIRLRGRQRAEAGLNIAIADPQATPSSLLETHLPVLQRAAESIGTALASVSG